MTTLSLLHKLSLIPSLFTELLTATALLYGLNLLANLIRLTVKATQFCWTAGITTGRFLKPWIWRAADAISALNAQIDWAQVRSDLRAYVLIITAAVVAALQVSWSWLRVNIPAAYIWYEQRFIDVPQSAPVASVTAIKPARDAKGRFVSSKRTVRRHGRQVALA